MPTVELDIRQLADEGGTAPLAPITVTDAVLDEDGNTLTDTLDEIKAGLNVSDISSNFTINSSYVDNFCANKTGKVAVVSFRIKASCPNNTTLVTISDSAKASYNDVVSPFFGSNGSIQTQGSAWIERSNRSVITYYGSSNMTSGAYATVAYIIS